VNRDVRAPAEALDGALRAVGQSLDGSDPGRLSFFVGKLRRHVAWARSEGVRRLIEEDQLNPIERSRTSWQKRRWRRCHGVDAGQGRAVFVVGLQRSGTNMVLRGIEHSPETEVHNENDRSVFRRYRLVDDTRVVGTVAGSRAACVLFKPLCDSHRTSDLLALPHLKTRPVALWIYRSVDGRVSSALAKFGDHDRTVLAAIFSGRGDKLWQVGGLSGETRKTLDSFSTAELSPASASALFWWARNSLVFDLGLADRADVAIVSYDRVVEAPASQMQLICRFLGMTFSSSMAAHIDTRSRLDPPSLDLDPRVRALCDALTNRLDAHALGATVSPARQALADQRLC
jgi:hypothetical protein